MTVTNVTNTLSWPAPPGIFLGASSVDSYLIIWGLPNRKVFSTQVVTAEERQTTIEWLEPLKNYTLRVVAILSDGRRGSIGWKNFQTTEGGRKGFKGAFTRCGPVKKSVRT